MPTQPLIVGNPVLLVIDFQVGFGFGVAATPVMPGAAERVRRAELILAAARAAHVPVIFFQEVHRRSGIDFGRELDGAEGVHCLDGDPATDLISSLVPSSSEFHIIKRRYSGFFATELDMLLRALRADTLILIGGLTDVCVHYTFADAHQRDFYVRVVEDCVGGSSEASHLASLDAMEYLQTGARRSTADIITALDSLTTANTYTPTVTAAVMEEV